MPNPNKSEVVRDIILKAIPLRRQGKTTKEIAEEIGIGVAVLFERFSRRSILANCPNLYDAFAASIQREKKPKWTKPNPHESLVQHLQGLLIEGQSVQYVYRIACENLDPKIAVKVAKAAMKRAYTSDDSSYRQYVLNVINHEITQDDPGNDRLDIFAVHANKRPPKKKYCEECNCKATPSDRLTQFCKDKKKGLQTLCRECLCENDPIADPMANFLVNHQNQAREIEGAYFYW